MKELKCPKCGTIFQVEESDYMEILSQVRTNEFNKELEESKERLASDKAKDLELLKSQAEAKYKELEVAKNAEIANLNAKISASDSANKAVVMEAEKKKDAVISQKDQAISGLQLELESLKREKESSENNLKSRYESEIKLKDEQIEQYKDFKLKQSTKMIGESLEKYCENEFNKLRATGFRTAYFEKDNDAKEGSKGDYIFRDFTDNGTEFISIMFEMKNEADETATKHKNEDFFKKLDDDRTKKKCEYAVLVSTLESDNEFYNTGIVDVSYKYEKMYVIRPQFFIQMITLLRNAALNTVRLHEELVMAKNQSVDITNFEANVNAFKERFGSNYRLASEKFGKAIEEIDKTIDRLNKIKDALTGCDRNLRLANNSIDDLSIKKLTKNNPTMKAKFEEVAKANAVTDNSEIVEEESN